MSEALAFTTRSFTITRLALRELPAFKVSVPDGSYQAPPRYGAFS